MMGTFSGDEEGVDQDAGKKRGNRQRAGWIGDHRPIILLLLLGVFKSGYPAFKVLYCFLHLCMLLLPPIFHGINLSNIYIYETVVRR